MYICRCVWCCTWASCLSWLEKWRAASCVQQNTQMLLIELEVLIPLPLFPFFHYSLFYSQKISSWWKLTNNNWSDGVPEPTEAQRKNIKQRIALETIVDRSNFLKTHNQNLMAMKAIGPFRLLLHEYPSVHNLRITYHWFAWVFLRCSLWEPMCYLHRSNMTQPWAQRALRYLSIGLHNPLPFESSLAAQR